MTPSMIRAAVLRALAAVAPEVDPDSINPDAPLREQVDIDSMDFLNFVIGIHKELGVSVPEKDYPKLTTLNSCLTYLQSASPDAQPIA